MASVSIMIIYLLVAGFVVKGDFCGVEGELASEANKTYVVIRIAGVLSASVKVPKSYLRVI